MPGVHRTSDGWKKCVAKTPETCRVVFEGGPAAHAASMEEGLENEAKELEQRNKEVQLASKRKTLRKHTKEDSPVTKTLSESEKTFIESGNRGHQIMVAMREDTPSHFLHALRASNDPAVSEAIARNRSAHPDTLVELSKSSNIYVRTGVASNPSTPSSALRMMSSDLFGVKSEPKDLHELMRSIARNPSSDATTLRNVYKATDDEEVRESLLKSSKLSPKDAERIVEDSFERAPRLIDAALDRDDLNKEILSKIMKKGSDEQFNKASEKELRRLSSSYLKATEGLDDFDYNIYAEETRKKLLLPPGQGLSDAIRKLEIEEKRNLRDEDYIQTLKNQVREARHHERKSAVIGRQSVYEKNFRERRAKLDSMSRTEIEKLHDELSVDPKGYNDYGNPAIKVEVEVKSHFQKKLLDEVKSRLKK